MGRQPHLHPVTVQDSGVPSHGVTEGSEQKGPVNISGLTASFSDRKVDSSDLPQATGSLESSAGSPKFGGVTGLL